MEIIEHLYDQYAESLYGFAAALLRDGHAAEEVVQEVFVRLMKRTQLKTVVRTPKAYLYQAVRNEVYSRLRKRRFRRWGRKQYAADQVLVMDGDPTATLAERDALEKVLQALPVKQREVVVLKAFQEMTFQEVAQALGISANTAASRYRYALQKMRGLLKQEGIES